MRPRLAFVINSIGYGGAERVLAALLEQSGHYEQRYDCHVILLDDEPERIPLPDRITKHRLDSRHGLGRSVWLLRKKARELQPVAMISFLVRANVATSLVAASLGIPSILCERMHLSSHLNGKYAGIGLLLRRLLPRLTYRWATLVLGVSTGVTSDLIERYGVSRSRARTIPNPYRIDRIESASAAPPAIALPDAFIVAVGRLEGSKNFPQLIDAYAQAKLPYSLVIAGEGGERAELEARIARLGLQDRVHLIGFLENPLPVVRAAEYYVSSSLNEGFPNAMVEAMILGKAVLATDCHSGPAEILHEVPKANCAGVLEAKYGILVEPGSVAQLAEGMRRLAVPELRRHYEQKSRERSKIIASSPVCDQFWEMIDEVVRAAS
jgi:glycosyltransferase involved in cell wall biosynthesis